MGRGKSIDNRSSKDILFSVPLGKRDTLLAKKEVSTLEAAWFNMLNLKEFNEAIDLKKLREENKENKFLFNNYLHKTYEKNLKNFRESLAVLNSKIESTSLAESTKVDKDSWNSLAKNFKELISGHHRKFLRENCKPVIDIFKTSVDPDLPGNKKELIGSEEIETIEYEVEKVVLLDSNGEEIKIRKTIAQSLIEGGRSYKYGNDLEDLPYECPIDIDLDDSILNDAYQKDIKVLIEGGYLEEAFHYGDLDEEIPIFIPSEKAEELYEINAAYIEY